MIVLRLDGMIPHPLSENLDDLWDLVWLSVGTEPAQS
jgi:hypothetical protein